MDKLRQRCLEYVNDGESTAHLAMGEFTYIKMKKCFEILKSMATSAGEACAAAAGAGTNPGSVRKTSASFGAPSMRNNNNNNQEYENRIMELEQLVQQRDNEIAIMVNMIRKEKNGGSGGMIPDGLLATRSSMAKDPSNQQVEAAAAQMKQQQQLQPRAASKAPQAPVDTSFTATFRVDPAVLDDPTRAFEAFKAHYPKNDIIRENKVLLKTKYDAAKELATSVNDARNQIKHLTLQIDKLHKQQAIASEGLVDSDCDAKATGVTTQTDQAAENRLKDQIEHFKLSYKKGFHELSELKKEIQHIQKMLEMSRIKLQKDFDLWYQRQGKSALLTEALLVAQPKSVTASDNNQNSQKAVVMPGKSVSPGRPERERETPGTSTVASASKKELWPESSSSVDVKKAASSTTSRTSSVTSNSSVRSSTARYVTGLVARWLI